MIILILVLLIILAIIVFSSKTKEEMLLNIKKIFYILAGIISFVLLCRVVPTIYAFLTSIILVCVPFMDKIIKILSFGAILKSILAKIQFTKKNNSTMNEDIASDILGVKKFSSIDQINAAFKEKMKIHHPDHGGSEERAKKLCEARDFLLKLKKRKK